MRKSPARRIPSSRPPAFVPGFCGRPTARGGPGLRRVQEKHGLLGVMWTVIGRDWTLAGPDVAHRLLGGASNGAIVCLHDGRDTTVEPDIRDTIEALRISIPQLLERGYRFESVSQILCPTN